MAFSKNDIDELVAAVQSGDVSEDQLSEEGALALSVGRGEVKQDQLSPEGLAQFDKSVFGMTAGRAAQVGGSMAFEKAFGSSTQPLSIDPQSPVSSSVKAGFDAAVNPLRLGASFADASGRISEQLGANVNEGLASRGVPVPIAATAGFATELVTDPVSLMSLGAKGLSTAKNLGKTAAQDLAERFGLKLSASELGGSRTLGLLESGFAKLPGSSDVMFRHKQVQLQQLAKLRDGLIAQGASDKTIEQVGLKIQDISKQVLNLEEAARKQAGQTAVKKVGQRLGASAQAEDVVGQQAFKVIKDNSDRAASVRNQAYDEAASLVPETANYRFDKLRQVTEDLLAQQKISSPSLRDSKLVAILEDLQDRLTKQVNVKKGQKISQMRVPIATSVSSINADRKAIVELINAQDGAAAFGVKGGTNASTGALKHLKSVMSEELDSAFSSVSPDAADAVALAKARHAEFIDTFGSDEIKQLIRVADKKPGQFVTSVFRPGNQKTIQKLEKAMGPTEFKKVRDRFTTDLLGIDQTGDLTGSQLKAQINRYGKDTIRAVYGQSGLSSLESLTKVLDLGESLPLKNEFARILVKQSPERVVDAIVKPGNTVNVLRAKALLGKDFKDVAEAWLIKQIEKSPDGIVNPNSFVTTLDKFGDKTVDMVLGPGRSAQFKQLAAVSRQMQEASKIASNPSQTAQSIVAAGMASHPIRALLTSLTTRPLAHIYLSRPMTTLLVEGLQLPGSSRRARDLAVQLSLVAGALGRKDKSPKTPR